MDKNLKEENKEKITLEDIVSVDKDKVNKMRYIIQQNELKKQKGYSEELPNHIYERVLENFSFYSSLNENYLTKSKSKYDIDNYIELDLLTNELLINTFKDFFIDTKLDLSFTLGVEGLEIVLLYNKGELKDFKLENYPENFDKEVLNKFIKRKKIQNLKDIDYLDDVYIRGFITANYKDYSEYVYSKDTNETYVDYIFNKISNEDFSRLELVMYNIEFPNIEWETRELELNVLKKLKFKLPYNVIEDVDVENLETIVNEEVLKLTNISKDKNFLSTSVLIEVNDVELSNQIFKDGIKGFYIPLVYNNENIFYRGFIQYLYLKKTKEGNYEIMAVISSKQNEAIFKYNDKEYNSIELLKEETNYQGNLKDINSNYLSLGIKTIDDETVYEVPLYSIFNLDYYSINIGDEITFQHIYNVGTIPILNKNLPLSLGESFYDFTDSLVLMYNKLNLEEEKEEVIVDLIEELYEQTSSNLQNSNLEIDESYTEEYVNELVTQGIYIAYEMKSEDYDFIHTARTSKGKKQDVKKRTFLDKKIKEDTLKRDGFKCQCCGIGEEAFLGTLVSHHVIPVHAGGKDSVENIVTLCDSDHMIIHIVERNRGALPISEKKFREYSPEIQKRLVNIMRYGRIAFEAAKMKNLTNKQIKEKSKAASRRRMPGTDLKNLQNIYGDIY